ncbi:Uncharacterised protein [Mycobacteroides abscessus subsp. abscessus]|nr:Uncharacterised protein [Mycobacteroides abscessus subsp. abscessus]
MQPVGADDDVEMATPAAVECDGDVIAPLVERSDGITKAVLDTGLSGVEEHSVEFCS